MLSASDLSLPALPALPNLSTLPTKEKQASRLRQRNAGIARNRESENREARNALTHIEARLAVYSQAGAVGFAGMRHHFSFRGAALLGNGKSADAPRGCERRRLADAEVGAARAHELQRSSQRGREAAGGRRAAGYGIGRFRRRWRCRPGDWILP